MRIHESIYPALLRAYLVPTVRDSFARPDAASLGAKWIANLGTWTIASNRAVPTDTTTSIATYKGSNFANSIIQATCDADFSATSIRAGLVARYQVSGDCYTLYFSRNASGSIKRLNLAWSNGGVLSVLANYATSATSGILRFVVNGTSLQGFLDGVLRVSATDANIASSGPVGLHGLGSGRMRNFLAVPLWP